MTTTELPQIIGWDPEGNALYDKDDLDERLEEFLQALPVEVTGQAGWLDIDCTIGTLFFGTDQLVWAERFLTVGLELLERQKLRVMAEMLAKEGRG